MNWDLNLKKLTLRNIHLLQMSCLHSETYRIKLVMTSTSQAYVPRVQDLRVIALA